MEPVKRNSKKVIKYSSKEKELHKPESEVYEKDASLGSGVSKLLRGAASSVMNNKKLVAAGTVGLGTGVVGSSMLDDGHDKSDHGRKKTAAGKDSLTRDIIQGVVAGAAGSVAGVASSVGIAKLLDNSKENKRLKEELLKKGEEMTPKEKADQKYAIAKSYENEGHERKSEEYKDKASRAYKRAYEKKAGFVGRSIELLKGSKLPELTKNLSHDIQYKNKILKFVKDPKMRSKFLPNARLNVLESEAGLFKEKSKVLATRAGVATGAAISGTAIYNNKKSK